MALHNVADDSRHDIGAGGCVFHFQGRRIAVALVHFNFFRPQCDPDGRAFSARNAVIEVHSRAEFRHAIEPRPSARAAQRGFGFTEKRAKFWLSPIEQVWNDGFRSGELKTIGKLLVAKNFGSG